MRPLLASLLISIVSSAVAQARENLYLREISACEPGSIVVRLVSDSGRLERRSFMIEGQILRRVHLTDEATGNSLDLTMDRSFGGAILLAPAPGADETLPQFRALHLDFELYQDLCASPELQALRREQKFPFTLVGPGPAASFHWYHASALAQGPLNSSTP